ncbi:unnamed protein product [Musa acuminata subsp. malaccensis]|uniref:(wild Malaysian banana) hypothetical protein n=1 Tax=Musa acuminata subsp. malaccensis TaxID=214687 RepID=A0A8D7AFQ9_MUSAM|nr:unnamed protein product [Musa acuminata subsp. malaccensis]
MKRRTVCDVSSPADREKLMKEINSTFEGKLDILLSSMADHSIGFTIACEMEEQSPKLFLMSTNFESALRLSQLAYPLVKASGRGGCVVNVSGWWTQ